MWETANLLFGAVGQGHRGPFAVVSRTREAISDLTLLRELGVCVGGCLFLTSE